MQGAAALAVRAASGWGGHLRALSSSASSASSDVADVCIVGSGMVGAALAALLGERGHGRRSKGRGLVLVSEPLPPRSCLQPATL